MDGNAIVYCEGFFNTPWGKTAHGLVRFTRRYKVTGIIDSRYAGEDAGYLLDGKKAGVPVFASLEDALRHGKDTGLDASHFVIGVAPDGGVLSPEMRKDILSAIRAGLNIDCGLHYFLQNDPEFSETAARYGVFLRDVRKTPERNELHAFTGKIGEIGSYRIALLGTDSSVGKRTSAWKLIDALEDEGLSSVMIGTGQTAWMQGARYGVMLDSLINDFVAGEIEHAALSAWEELHPSVMVIEGQGSLMNPMYPGGFEILAAGQPHAVVLQHAPARKEYDGLPGYPIQNLEKQVQAIELISGKPVIAITVNHEGIDPGDIEKVCREVEAATGLPARDPLLHGLGPIVEVIRRNISTK